MRDVEVSIEQAKTAINLRNSLVKLMENKDFQAVIEVGYLKEEAVRMVMARGNFNLTPETRENISNALYGVASLEQFFQEIIRNGASADAALGEHEQTREDILAEEANS